MRKLVPVLALIVLLGSCFPVFAQRIGSPGRTTDTGSWTVSLQWEHWQREMYFDKLRDDHRTKTNMYALRWEYGATQELELNFKLGAAETNVPYLHFNGGGAFAAGVGTKAILYESGELTVGAVGQASYFESNGRILGFSSDIGIMQYDLGVGVAYQMDRLCPYGGALLSYVDGNIDSAVGADDFESDDPWGIFLGINYEWREDVTIGAEAEAYGDGWGISFRVGYSM